MTAKFDALAAAQALARAGVEEPHAKAIAGIVRDSRADLATTDDVLAVKADIHAVKAELRVEIAGSESRMQAMIYRALWIQTGAIVGTIIAAAGLVAAVVA